MWAKRGERGVRRYLLGGSREKTEPVNAFAIEREQGVCLFDTGQTAAAAGRGYFSRERDSPELSSFCRERRVVFLAVHDPRARRLVEAAW